MQFCKDFKCEDLADGEGPADPGCDHDLPGQVLHLEMKTPPMSYFLKKAAKIESGSKTPDATNVAKVTTAQVREIAEKKMVDLNCDSVESAMRMVEGSRGRWESRWGLSMSIGKRVTKSREGIDVDKAYPLKRRSS